MRRRLAFLSTAVAIVIGSSAVVMTHDGFRRHIREFLSGNEELPIVLTQGRGVLTASINNEGTAIAYKLRYSGLETDVTQAHIHIGQQGFNGGIALWLCANITGGNVPAGLQACPVREGEIEGELDADDVVGPAAQGVVAGDFERVLFAIKTGNAYVNVHTTRSPTGEIRSQINHSHGR
jgi:hypothetical protein